MQSPPPTSIFSTNCIPGEMTFSETENEMGDSIIPSDMTVVREPKSQKRTMMKRCFPLCRTLLEMAYSPPQSASTAIHIAPCREHRQQRGSPLLHIQASPFVAGSFPIPSHFSRRRHKRLNWSVEVGPLANRAFQVLSCTIRCEQSCK